MALGQFAGEKWRQRQAATAWLSEADLGVTEADLARARSVLQGCLTDAEIELPSVSGTKSTSGDLSAERLAAVTLQAYQKLDAEIGKVVEKRVTQRAGPLVHGLFEIAFCLLPSYLVFHLARNFFYEHLWQKAPLLGLDFFFQSAFWCLVWGVMLGGLLLHWLNYGLDRQLKEAVVRHSHENIFDPLYAESTTACRAIRRHASGLESVRGTLKLLEAELGGVLDLGLGAQRTSSKPSATVQRYPSTSPQHQGIV
jgi:hypothetical protein